MRILQISYALPPFLSAQSLSTLKATRGLAALGYDVRVVAVAPTEKIRKDAELARLIPTTVQVTRVAPEYEGMSRLLTRTVPFLAAMPDAMVGWYRPAVTAARGLIEKQRPDLLYSRSQPFTSHLVARTLAREFGLPWIAYLSDPLYDNPYYNQFPVNPHRMVNKRIEAIVFGNADEIHFVSRETQTLAERRYPPEVVRKFVTIPHCYEEAFFPQANVPSAPPLIVSYVGDFQSARSPVYLFEALADLKNETPGLAERLTVRLVGRVRPKDLMRLNDLGLDNIVEVVGRVSYTESLSYVVNSHVLLLIDGSFKDGNVFFPSKLADYLGSGRPIIGMTPPGSTSNRILREMGYPSVGPTDIAGIVSLLRGALDGVPAGQPPPAQYDSRTVAEQISARLEGLVDSRRTEASAVLSESA